MNDENSLQNYPFDLYFVGLAVPMTWL